MSQLAPEEMGRLLVGVCRLHHTRADQTMEKIGLFRGQAILLMILSEQDGMSHSEVAERLKVSPAAATKVIKRMEQEGYVQRRADPADERVSRVCLEPKGHAIIAEIRTAFEQIDRQMLEGLTDSQLAVLREVLVRLQANLRAYQP